MFSRKLSLDFLTWVSMKILCLRWRSSQRCSSGISLSWNKSENVSLITKAKGWGFKEQYLTLPYNFTEFSLWRNRVRMYEHFRLIRSTIPLQTTVLVLLFPSSLDDYYWPSKNWVTIKWTGSLSWVSEMGLVQLLLHMRYSSPDIGNCHLHTHVHSNDREFLVSLNDYTNSGWTLYKSSVVLLEADNVFYVHFFPKKSDSFRS